MEKNQRWYTVTQTAEEAGVTVSYVRKLLRANVIRGEKIGPRAWMIPLNEVKKICEYEEGHIGRPRSGRKK